MSDGLYSKQEIYDFFNISPITSIFNNALDKGGMTVI